MALNLQTLTKILKAPTVETKPEITYWSGDEVAYLHTRRNEFVTGVISFIDWDGSKALAIPDGIARAYVIGHDFADYVEAWQLRPAGTYGIEVQS